MLNATFGNAPELIFAVVALKAGLFDMVRASIIGAILANLLLAQGVAFLLGGLRYHEQVYHHGTTRLYSTMMLIAVVSMLVPSTFSRFFSSQAVLPQEQYLNLGLAAILLSAYGLYLLFMLKTHTEFFSSVAEAEEPTGDEQPWPLSRALWGLVLASCHAAWMSEILVGAAAGTGRALGMSQTFIGLVFLAIVGGAAEIGSAVTLARKNKVDLAIGIALGSCIQIALFVAPLLVLISYAVAPAPFVLSFGRPEVGSLFLAVLIGALVSGDGRSNWFKGAQLIVVYLLLALLFYFIPEGSLPLSTG